MTESVRCPGCRGAKKVPKLGGMIGECNMCSGKGTILVTDKPAKVEVISEDVCVKEMINAVADRVPSSIESLPVTPKVKVDAKKALYKRKKA